MENVRAGSLLRSNRFRHVSTVTWSCGVSAEFFLLELIIEYQIWLNSLYMYSMFKSNSPKDWFSCQRTLQIDERLQFEEWRHFVKMLCKTVIPVSTVHWRMGARLSGLSHLTREREQCPKNTKHKNVRHQIFSWSRLIIHKAGQNSLDMCGYQILHSWPGDLFSKSATQFAATAGTFNLLWQWWLAVWCVGVEPTLCTHNSLYHGILIHIFKITYKFGSLNGKLRVLCVKRIHTGKHVWKGDRFRKMVSQFVTSYHSLLCVTSYHSVVPVNYDLLFVHEGSSTLMENPTQVIALCPLAHSAG